MTDRKIFISELAKEVDRRESTIRGWCRTGKLPKRLQPKQNGKSGWRYWTPAQVEGIKAWMKQRNMIPGAGLMNFDPSPERTQEFLDKLRETRK